MGLRLLRAIYNEILNLFDRTSGIYRLCPSLREIYHSDLGESGGGCFVVSYDVAQRLLPNDGISFSLGPCSNVAVDARGVHS